MERLLVESSFISSIGHENTLLEIEFNSGKIFKYFDVPERISEELENADSVGKYFHQNILNKFQYEEIPQDFDYFK